MFNNKIAMIAASLGLSVGSEKVVMPELNSPNDGFTKSKKGKSRSSIKPSGEAKLKRTAKTKNNIRKRSKY